MKLRIAGIPRPKGSKRAFLPPHATRPVVIEQNSDLLKPWMSDIKYQAQQYKLPGEVPSGPVSLALTFYMPRPKNAPKRILYPTKRPDLDKLCRAVKDAIKDVLYRDDSQVVFMHATKMFGNPGVEIALEYLSEEQIGHEGGHV